MEAGGAPGGEKDAPCARKVLENLNKRIEFAIDQAGESAGHHLTGRLPPTLIPGTNQNKKGTKQMRSRAIAPLAGITAIVSPLTTIAEYRPMRFFVTNEGMVDGGHPGGLEGADAHRRA